jgi:transposase InsO family protein
MPSNNSKYTEEIRTQIAEYILESGKSATSVAEEMGIAISEYMTRKIMKENGFLPLVAKKYRPSHNGKSNGKYYPDLVNQNFTEESQNKVWVGDITYIKTRIGFAYLAVVIDLYNREVVGYAISKTANAELVKLALGNAIARAGGSVEGLIFHSDRGTQYSSKSFRKMLKEYGVISSMSRPACPYDNACSECFFSTAKRECIYRTEYLNIEEVKRDLFEYIELFYNRRRIHASLGYLSPAPFRLSYKLRKRIIVMTVTLVLECMQRKCEHKVTL